MATKYDAKTKAKAEAAAKATVANYGSASKISALKLERASKEDNSMLLTWTCPLSNIAEFRIDVEYQNAAGNWINLNNSADISVEPAKASYGGTNKYQYLFNAPSDPTVRQVHARVHAVAKTRTVKKSYPGTKKVYDAKKRKYVKKTVKMYVELKLAYWTAGWTGWATAAAPALSDAEKAKLAAPTVKLAAPSADLQADGSIRVSWSRPTESCVTGLALFRLADGAQEDARVQLGGIMGLTTTEYADAAVEPGRVYRYLAMPYNGNSSLWGPVGSAGDDVQTAPLAPSGLEASAAGPDSALLAWEDNGYRYCGASYRIFASPHADAWRRDETGTWVPARDDIREVSNELKRVGSANQFTVTGLDPGSTWWFTVALVGDGGTSPLCEPVSCVLASVPEAPTAAYMATAAVKGEDALLSWTHNAEDGSAQTAAQVEVAATAPGGGSSTATYEAGSASEYALDTSGMADGTAVAWRVRTKGASPEWSPWSGPCAFTVYARPEAGIQAYQGFDGGKRVDSGEPLETLPLVLAVTAGSGTSQAPVEYAVEIVASEGFRFADEDGEEDWMAGGTVLASYYVTADDGDFDAARQVISVGARDGAFASGVTLQVRAMALMDSGLQTEWAQAEVTPRWSSTLPVPSATASALDDWSAAIWPVCEDPRQPAEGTIWMLEGTRLTIVSVPGAAEGEDEGEVTVRYLATDGTEGTWEESGSIPMAIEMSDAEGYLSPISAEVVLPSGTYTLDLADDSELAHETYPTVNLVEDAVLSVWRIAADGEAVAIAQGIANTGSVVVTDPHPDFGTCRYRVVANSLATDEITFSEAELELPCEFLYIQWDEGTATVTQGDDEGSVVTSHGKAVRLDADIALTESGRKDKTLNEYAGRRFPVADYGTQLGITGSTTAALNLDIDPDAIPLLRQLQEHMGPCYVRWPARNGGLGYRADVDVEIGHPLRGVKVSVRLDITRIDEDAR